MILIGNLFVGRCKIMWKDWKNGKCDDGVMGEIYER